MNADYEEEGRRQTAGSRKQEAGSRRRAAGGRREAGWLFIKEEWEP